MSACRNIRFIASAGTGKTHQVVNLYRALLFGRPYPADDTALPGVKEGAIFDGKAPIPPERILMLTFTKNAAAEMRSRVTEAVERELAEGNPDTEASCWSLLRRLPSAVISTIHSFAQQLLSSHTLFLGLSPNLTILEEADAEDLRTEAIEAALKAGLTGPEAADLECLCDGRRTEGIKDGIVRALRLTAAWGLDLETSAPATLVATPTPPTAAALQRLLKPVEQAAEARTGKTIKTMATELSATLRRLGDSPSTEAIVKAAGELRKLTTTSWGKDDGVKHLREEVQQTLDALAAYPDRVRARRLLIAFLTVTRDCAQRIRACKRVQGVLDFDDLLFKARELIEARPDAVPGLDVIIVDEAQDNSRIQNELIRRVQSISKAAMVMCGDTKQTIYGWRGADSEGLSRLATDMQLEAVPLRTSYRSQKGILDWVNDICTGVVFTPERYGDNETLAPCPQAKTLDGPSVELLLPDWEWGPQPNDPITTGKKQEQKPRLTLTPKDVRGLADSAPADTGLQAVAQLTVQATALEARAVARRIRLLTTPGAGAHWHPSSVWNPTKGDWIKAPAQPYRFRDILILLRASTRQELYEQALQEEGIPFTTDGKGRGFFTRQETLDISNLLSWLAFPNDRLALIGVLRSPFVALSDNAVAVIEQARGDLSCSVDAPADTEAKQRAQHVFAGLRNLSGRISAVDLVREAIRLTGYDAILAGTFHGVQRLANLQKLLSWIQARERDETLSLQGVARRLSDEISGGRETPDAAVLDPDDDSVRINTIHAAKGLSSPVVILPDLRRIPNADHDWILVERDTDGQARAVTGKIKEFVRDDAMELESEGFAGASERNKQDRDHESRRLFYVACTRARDLLILSGENPSNGNKDAWRSWVNRHVIQCDFDADLIRLRPYGEVETAWRKIAVPPPPPMDPIAETFMCSQAPPERAQAERYRFPATLLTHFRPGVPSPHPTPLEGEGVYSLRLALAPVNIARSTREEGESPDPLSDRAQLGTLAHRILESLDYGSAVPPATQIDQSPEWAEATASDRKRLHPQLIAAAQALTSILAGVEAEDHLCELPFAARVILGGAELIVDGKADLVFFKDGTWHLVDYKFSDHTIDRLKDRYALQLATYRDALSAPCNDPILRTPRFETRRRAAAPFKLLLLGINTTGEATWADVTNRYPGSVAEELIAAARQLTSPVRGRKIGGCA